MQILHIGDFHYKAKSNNYDQNFMIDEMIKNLKSKDKIDFIFFSGDLVHSGTNYEHYEEAHKVLVEKLLNELSVPIENFIICEGNHDIDREESSKAVVDYFDEKIKDNNLLNDSVKKNDIDFKSSIKPSQNFNTYLRKYFITDSDNFNDLYTVQKRSYESKQIGIVTFNSAWLCSGFRQDDGRLMFPVQLLKDAITALGKCDCNIIMFHHPLNYFKEFNANELEDLIHKDFNLMFSGHIHREQIAAKYQGGNGIFSNTTQAALAYGSDVELGYSLVKYDFENPGQVILYRGTYEKKRQIFIDVDPIVVTIPCGLQKENQNRIRSRILSKFSYELNKTNELLLEYSDELEHDFLDLYTKPVLSTKTDAETSKGEDAANVNFDDLLLTNENFLIFGKDKCGKTSLLKRLQLNYLKRYTTLSKIPYYIDYKDLETKEATINIKKDIRIYYDITNQDVENIIANGQLVLLIDNLDTNSQAHQSVLDFIHKNGQTQFIICSEYLATRIYIEGLDHFCYNKIFFKNLRRKDIRSYTEKYKSVKEEQREDVIEKVTKFCQQLQLPVNYWTISLILLIYKKTNDYNKNLFEILDVCIDEILQKKALSQRNKLGFDDYKEICSHIAYYLLTNHKQSVYACGSVELIRFIDEKIQENIRLSANATDVFDYLLKCNILKEKAGKYTFRLNGVFEYFLSYYIKNHAAFKEEIINSDIVYLQFKNELEIYSGFNRDDKELLEKIYLKTKNVIDDIIEDCRIKAPIDATLLKKVGEANEFAEEIKKMKISKPLKHSIKDAVQDEANPLDHHSEVHLKSEVKEPINTAETLEKYLSILARVFRNSSKVNDHKLVTEIFEYLLETYCYFGFYIIDELSMQAKQDQIESNPELISETRLAEDMLKMIANFIPILVQSLLFDGVGHASFEKLIKNKIGEFKQDKNENQYKLFLLYFLLIDSDIKGNKRLIEEAMQCLSLAPLKVSIFFKLNFYHAFKAYDKKELEQYLSEQIKIAQLNMNNKTDAGDISKFITNSKKGNIVRRNTNR